MRNDFSVKITFSYKEDPKRDTHDLNRKGKNTISAE